MLRLSVVICSLLFSFAVQAEVYKWVDADGKTHFGDKAPESTKVETLNLPNTPSTNQPDVSPQEIKQRQQKMLEVFAGSRNAQNAKKEAKQAESREQLRKTCNQSARVMYGVQTGSLYTTGKDGKPNYLPESERASIAQQAEQFYKKNCR